MCTELLPDFRIPKPPECSQGAQRAVFCAVRVADFLAEGAGWGASPGRGFFFNDTATTEIYTLSLHDALPIYQISLESKLNGRQKVKGGNGSISASISTSIIASVIASIITLNLGQGCAPSCCQIFVFRNLPSARRGHRGQFFVQSE